ncbi:UDP-2,4-diacetamido-2,4,6-trideoxy-beta-L-altropyranose hydrolase [Virgibacillus sp. W0181]|uniref:UDP-2,4-diacetamido-2,4, 6-trideoxy-beta-L-altropyranose hydrolase n=1 Tax=Virgibacillus sp. W0181 TaxID=3391581 RepID=UPI003F47CFB2
MNICFRVDSSTKIGSGHVIRCLTLAEELKENSHNVYFICRAHQGNLNQKILEKGFQLYNLEDLAQNMPVSDQPRHASWLGVTQAQDSIETQKALQSIEIQFDWIIVDHYALDEAWEKEIRVKIPNIMVIDDIADREHDCDILLDQNYYQNANSRYKNLVPSNCKLLLGPKYALLRDEFVELHNKQKEKKKHSTALVFYGGSDPTNETMKALKAIKGKEITTHVVVGPSNPNKDLIKEHRNNENVIFHYNINYMAKLMHEVDFAICAGGSTTWERYCLGTPAILTAIAYNQIEVCENVHKLGIDHYIGEHDTITQHTIAKEINSFITNKDIPSLSKKAKRIVDGYGKNRIIELLEMEY